MITKAPSTVSISCCPVVLSFFAQPNFPTRHTPGTKVDEVDEADDVGQELGKLLWTHLCPSILSCNILFGPCCVKRRKHLTNGIWAKTPNPLKKCHQPRHHLHVQHLCCHLSLALAAGRIPKRPLRAAHSVRHRWQQSPNVPRCRTLRAYAQLEAKARASARYGNARYDSTSAFSLAQLVALQETQDWRRRARPD